MSLAFLRVTITGQMTSYAAFSENISKRKASNGGQKDREFVLNLAVQAFLFIDSKEAATAALEQIKDGDRAGFGNGFFERIKA